MAEARPIGVGVIGLGFMGRMHVDAYRGAAAAGFANRLIAVCDRDPERRAGRIAARGNLEKDRGEARLFDPGAVRGCADPLELIADRAVELVSICTHTETHVPLALAALEAGKHVLVEKPLALSSRAIEPLAAAARVSRTLCMPALCMRFWPGWSWLRERVVAGDLGRVRSAVFRRLGSRPAWAGEFYGDAAKSGGALFDLHVHDADFVEWCFGTPESVSSTGSLDHVTTLYRYADGPSHVVAEGGWDHAPGFPFRMRFTVVFDEATADFDLAREPQLLLARGGRAEPVELPRTTGYDEEVRHLLARIRSGTRDLAATIDGALSHTKLIEAERASLESGEAVRCAPATL